MVSVLERARLPPFSPFQGVTGHHSDMVCNEEVESMTSLPGPHRLPPRSPS